MTDVTERIKEMAAHTYGTWGRQSTWKAPLLITDAEGVYFFDHTGKRYLDFSSQLMCSNPIRGCRSPAFCVSEKTQQVLFFHQWNGGQ